MNSWCSVIIPTLNEERHLPDTLRRLPLEEVEVVISDGGSSDNTRQIARSFGAIVVVSPPGRARQLNTGARAASGQWFYFLHADTTPPQNLSLHLRAAAQIGLPARFAVRFDREDENRWLALFGRMSKYDVSVFRFGDQSLFLSREQFQSSGGYREDHELMEGHELARRIEKSAGGFRVMNGAVTTSSRRYLRYGVVFTQLVFVLIVALYYSGIPQRRLVEIYKWAFS
ncbi:TIGR04283 family arsenosugar biosynthesis glycosyltransferase [Neolewinella aurantiaca]|uniref:TIGR04283 family arsenosugar biosynthesis glycosyltransferase n=1 Tax=Neolewinella aurantiaca TaxID=2602767 RepID=UPI00164EE030|nr:TIGR04283 family arsenosugar biosynthesis glycosyltransferase [Neolewinella aurantiaca]